MQSQETQSLSLRIYQHKLEHSLGVVSIAHTVRFVEEQYWVGGSIVANKNIPAKLFPVLNQYIDQNIIPFPWIWGSDTPTYGSVLISAKQ